MSFSRSSDSREQTPSSQQSRATTDRFLTVMHGTADLFWILASTGKMQDSDSNWSSFTGQQEQEALGNGWLDAVYGADRPHLEALLTQPVDLGQAVEHTCHIRRKDGVYRLMHLRLFPVCTLAGTVCEWVVSGTDITTEYMNEAQIHLAMETSRIGLWQYDLPTQQFIATEQWKRLYGLSPDAPITYEAFLALVHPDDRPRIAAINVQARTQSTIHEVQFRIIWPDGSLHWMTSQLQSIADVSNQSDHLIGSTMDITALKVAQEQITDILESITEAFFHLDQEWRITYANHHISTLTDLNWSALLGQPFWDIRPQLRGTLFEHHLRTAMETQQTMDFEFYAPEEHKWAEVHVYPTKQEGISVYMYDITQRKQVEEALQERECQFRHLIDSNIIGIMIADLEGHIYEANDAFLTLLGYTQADLAKGQLSWRNLTPEEYRGADDYARQEMAATGTAHPYEKAYYRKDGVRVPVLMGGTLFGQKGDQPMCIACIVDLTAQKELDQQKELMLSMTSHELKTPLAALKGTIQLVQRQLGRIIMTKDQLPPQWSTFVEDFLKRQESALRQVEVQTHLINNLLDVSRINTQMLELSLHDADLVSLVRLTVEDLQLIAPERVLQLVLPEQAEVTVLIDPDRIREVLVNYITNAFRYAPPDEPIIVGLTLEGTMARVWVRDLGPGLTVGDQQNVWQRHHQIKGVPIQSGSGKGLGLGLYICQMLIRQQQGEVGVDSARGKGSTFWFTLPIAT